MVGRVIIAHDVNVDIVMAHQIKNVISMSMVFDICSS